MPFYTRPNFEDRQVVQYSGTSISLSGITNIDQSGYLKINKGAFPGLVATSLDSDGTVVWGPISGVSWSVSACTSPLYVNNLVSCPLSAGTIQVDAGNLALNSELNFLISLSAGTNTDEVLVIDNNGYIKTIPNLMGIGNMWHIPVGYTLTVPDNYQSFIYGDILIEGTIDLQTNAQLVILNGNIILSGGSIIGSGTTYLVTLGGGSGCCFTGGTGSCITDLYVSNIHSCSPLNINPLDECNVYFGSTSGVTVDVINKRIGINTSSPNYTFDFNSSDGNTRLHYLDTTPTAQSIYFSGNSTVMPQLGISSRLSSFPLTIGVTMGLIGENSTSYPGYGNPLDGFLYAGADTNRLNIISAPTSSVGTNSDDIRFYAGQFVNSGFGADMHIQGSGTTRGYIGVGTENPTAKLEVNGKTKTTNFQMTSGATAGYVLTSDLDGNATWQASTGGGSGTTIVQFTGNTSGTCINDLYVHNLYGCSPIMLHDIISGNSTNSYIDITSNSQTAYFSTKHSGSEYYLNLGFDSSFGSGTARLGQAFGPNLRLGGGAAFMYGPNQLFLSTNSKSIDQKTSYGLDINVADSANVGGSLFTVRSNSSAGGGAGLTGGTLQCEIVLGKPNYSLIGLNLGVMGTGLGTGTNFYGVAGFDYYPVFISTPRSYAYDNTSYSSIKNVLFGGGSDNKVYTGVTNSALIGGSGNTINQSLKNTVIIGGEGITGTSSNTVYVPNLNISVVGSGTSVTGLGLDTNGFVVTNNTTTTFFTNNITTLATLDVNGYRVLYPFTASTSGEYIFDATTRVNLAGIAPTNDITTLGVVNGTTVTSVYRTTIGVGMTVTHTEKKKVTLSAGDVFHYGVVNPVTDVLDGSMIIFKIS